MQLSLAGELARRAITLDKWSLGRLITVFEDPRPKGAELRSQVLEAVHKERPPRRAMFVGITGAPGAGKSSLIGELATRLMTASRDTAVAVLAVDPSSQVSGGALLGDRTRVRFPIDERRLFFRSQASDRELGGVSRATFPVCRLLHLLFDVVFVETVGIGQSELEIQHVADFTYLVLSPLGGDQVQFMKAGIMEIPDAFVLNKCDEARAAEESYHALRASLSLARPGDADRLAIHKTSTRNQEGLDALADEIRRLAPQRRQSTMRDKEPYFFERWVRDEFGRSGLRWLASRNETSDELLAHAGGYEAAQVKFSRDYVRT